MMNEEIRARIVLLNAVWQRYAKIAEETVDPMIAAIVNRDYLAVWEELEAYGIVESMLAYDPETLTFSLPTTVKGADDQALPIRGARSRWRNDALDSEPRQLL